MAPIKNDPATPTPAPRPRGRPIGSKNKPKVPTVGQGSSSIPAASRKKAKTRPVGQASGSGVASTAHPSTKKVNKKSMANTNLKVRKVQNAKPSVNSQPEYARNGAKMPGTSDFHQSDRPQPFLRMTPAVDSNPYRGAPWTGPTSYKAQQQPMPNGLSSMPHGLPSMSLAELNAPDPAVTGQIAAPGALGPPTSMGFTESLAGFTEPFNFTDHLNPTTPPRETLESQSGMNCGCKKPSGDLETSLNNTGKYRLEFDNSIDPELQSDAVPAMNAMNTMNAMNPSSFSILGSHNYEPACDSETGYGFGTGQPLSMANEHESNNTMDGQVLNAYQSGIETVNTIANGLENKEETADCRWESRLRDVQGYDLTRSRGAADIFEGKDTPSDWPIVCMYNEPDKTICRNMRMREFFGLVIEASELPPELTASGLPVVHDLINRDIHNHTWIGYFVVETDWLGFMACPGKDGDDLDEVYQMWNNKPLYMLAVFTKVREILKYDLLHRHIAHASPRMDYVLRKYCGALVKEYGKQMSMENNPDRGTRELAYSMDRTWGPIFDMIPSALQNPEPSDGAMDIEEQADPITLSDINALYYMVDKAMVGWAPDHDNHLEVPITPCGDLFYAFKQSLFAFAVSLGATSESHNTETILNKLRDLIPRGSTKS